MIKCSKWFFAFRSSIIKIKQTTLNNYVHMLYVLVKKVFISLEKIDDFFFEEKVLN